MAIYCDDVVPAYQQDCCANEEGRIIAIAYIRSDSIMSPANYTSAGTWTSEIAAGLVEVIKCVRGDKPKSTETSIDGYGRQATRTVSRQFTVNYRHADVIDNIDFYNVLNFSTSYRIAYYAQDGRIFVVENDIVNVDADYVIPEGLDSLIDWEVLATWTGSQLQISYDAPASIFEE